MLRLEYVGGFVEPRALFSRVPAVSVFSDGRVIVAGPVPAIYPGPAVPPLLSFTVDAEGMRRIVRGAVAAGLAGPNPGISGPVLPDVPTTVFVFVRNGVRHVVSVQPAGDGGPGRALAAFESKLLDLPRWLGAHAGPVRPYRPDALAVGVLPPPATGPEPSPNVVAWPLPHRPLATFGSAPGMPGVRCDVVAGADLAALWPVAGSATQITLWTSSGRDYALAFRPLLPDERSCPTQAAPY